MILSLETSTTVCSAALHSEGNLIAFEITHTPNSAASQLAVMVDKMLKQSFAKLEAVAVSSGPGSYTGLRIGVATAKGICYAMSLPLISVNSLELMASQVRASEPKTPHLAPRTSHPAPRTSHPALRTPHLFCPMIDARRMEVYTTLLDSQLNIVSPTEAKVIDELSFTDQLENNTILFFGNGADKCKTTITHANAVFVDNIFPSAEWMGALAYDSFRANKFEDLGEFEPAYLKDFIAKKPKSLV